MNITKSDILDFVDKVESKAIDAIDSKYNPLIEKAKEEALNSDLLISKSLKEAESALTLAVNKLENVKARAKELGIKEHEYGHNLDNKIARINTACSEIKPSYLSQFIIPSVDAVKDEKDAKRSEVRDAYRLIYSKVRRMSSKKNMMELLRGLGFDLSSLESPSKPKFDKETLFPCRYLKDNNQEEK